MAPTGPDCTKIRLAALHSDSAEANTASSGLYCNYSFKLVGNLSVPEITPAFRNFSPRACGCQQRSQPREKRTWLYVPRGRRRTEAPAYICTAEALPGPTWVPNIRKCPRQPSISLTGDSVMYAIRDIVFFSPPSSVLSVGQWTEQHLSSLFVRCAALIPQSYCPYSKVRSILFPRLSPTLHAPLMPLHLR